MPTSQHPAPQYDADEHLQLGGNDQQTSSSSIHAQEDPEKHTHGSTSPPRRASSFVQLQSSLAQELWASRAWRLYPVILIYISGLAMLGPLTPTLLTNYFASRTAGEDLRCESLHPQPPACQNAHSEVVTWSSWCSFVSNSVLSVVTVGVGVVYTNHHHLCYTIHH